MNRLLRTTLFTAALCAAAPAWADNDGDNATESIARVVPYDGVLDLDGAGYNGLVDIVFTLYDASSGGDVVWTETWSAAEGRAVTITGGRFSVNLGTFDDIEPAIADGAQLYLGLHVKLPEAEAYTPLSGRQRLNPVPYALWGARASNLDVGGAAHVGGDLTVAGDANVGQINVDELWVNRDNGNPARALAFLNNRLYIGQTGAFGDGLRTGMHVHFERNLYVEGLTTLAGSVNVNQTLSLASSLNLNDGNGSVSALSISNNYLRLGTSGRFGNGVLVPTNFRVQSSADIDGNLNVDGNATVDGTLSVAGNVSLSDCRVCQNFTSAASPRGGHTCVTLTPGSVSAPVTVASQVLGNSTLTTYSLVFLCDGGGSGGGNGTIRGDGTIN